MTAATQSAAFESVDDVLGNVSGRTNHGRQQGHPERSQYPYDPSQHFGHQRDGSNGSGGSGGMMPPPTLRRPGAFVNNLQFGIHTGIGSDGACGKTNAFTGNSNLTPSQHRTQLGSKGPPHLQQNSGHHVQNTAPGPSYAASSSQRLPLGGPGSVNRPTFGGYGMSAGLKVGRSR